MRTKLVHTYSANTLAPPNIRTGPPIEHPFVAHHVINNHLHHSSAFADFRRTSMPQRGSIISNVDLLHDVKETKTKDNQNPGACGYIQDLSSRIFKKKTLYRKLPFLNWIQEYNTNTLVADLIAGFIISLSFLPQSLAYATIAGLPPQVGLWSGFLGPFVYAFFGTSKYVTIGPTAGLAMITLSFIEGKPPHLYIFLAFVTGVTTLSMGLLHLGFLLNFISVPVLSAFTSAMAVSIMSTQLPGLLGMDYTEDSFLHMVKTTIKKIGGFSWQDLTLGLVCIFVIIILQHTQEIAAKCYKKKIPNHLDNFFWFLATARNAIVVIICTIVFGYLGDPLAHEIIGRIEPGIHFSIPPFWFIGNYTEHGEVELSAGEFLRNNWSILIMFPLIALTEHLMIAKDLDGGSDRLDASQEMICVGLSNLLGSFFGSMPVTGSFVRPNKSHREFKNQSPLGGCVTGVLVILTLLFLTPYFIHIPKAAIAAVIIAEVLETIEIGILREMWKSKHWDLLPWVVTFLCGILVTLEHGLLFGLAISVVYILYYSAIPQIKVNMGMTAAGKSFVMVELDRSLIFPAIDYSQYALMKSGTIWAQDKSPVVIACQHIQFVDYSAAHAFQVLFHKFNAKPQRLILWKMKPSVLRTVEGVMKCKGEKFEHCSTERELELWLSQYDPQEKLEFEHRLSILTDSPRLTIRGDRAEVGCRINEENETETENSR